MDVLSDESRGSADKEVWQEEKRDRSETKIQIIEIHKEQKLGARRLERSWNSNIISMSHTVRYHEARIQALPTDSR